MEHHPKHIDLSEFRAKAEQAGGPRYWRSLSELSDTPAFRDLIYREFPKAASEWDDRHSRRDFLKVMGASLALAGVSAGCGGRRPEEKIIPYVQQPEELVLGRPLFYASTMPLFGFGHGVLVEQHEGRPTKIEGNPDHPASLGATNVFLQASVLTLYDPDRSQIVLRYGNSSTWGRFVDRLRNCFSNATVKPRVRILTETVTSPTLADQVAALKQGLPDVQWHCYAPVSRDNARAGAAMAFGKDVTPVYHLDKAKVVLSLDDNFLLDEPGSVRYARDFTKARRRPMRASELNRLYVLETSPTITGAYADNRLRLPPSALVEAARALSQLLGADHQSPSTQPSALDHFGLTGERGAKLAAKLKEFLVAVSADLLRNKGASVVVAGEYQPPEIHALAYAMNMALGSVGDGKPVRFIKSPEASPGGGVESLRELTRALQADEVDLLLILGGNPVYTAPVDIPFAAALKTFTQRIDRSGAGAGEPGLSVHLSLHEDETSHLCEWHLPQAHYLESWGDARAFDGTASITQPLIAPLYEGRSASELLAAIVERLMDGSAASNAAAATQPSAQPNQPATPASQPSTSTGESTAPATQPTESATATDQPAPHPATEPSASTAAGAATQPGGVVSSAAIAPLGGYALVRAYWRRESGAKNDVEFEQFWEQSLLKGVIANSQFPTESVSLKADMPALAADLPAAPGAGTGKGLTVLFRPDPHIWDGSFSNNGWLQELPKPLTKLTWDNAVIISPRTAVDLGLIQNELDYPSQADQLQQVLGMLVRLELNHPTAGKRAIDHQTSIWILPGHPDGCATLHLGYGRTSAGAVGTGCGFDAYQLRASNGMWSAGNVQATFVNGRYPLATTQHHQLIDSSTNYNRDLVRHGTDINDILKEEEKKSPPVPEWMMEAGGPIVEEHSNLGKAGPGRTVALPVLPDDPRRSSASLYASTPDQGMKGHNPLYPAWGMVIDLSACISCNACVIACVAENNIPVVGKDQVIAQREMHWIRIDTYFATESDQTALDEDPQVLFQPLPCMHCEKAPCELVCPVEATQHDVEGLNVMTYNRCVGTRYCSNNCPYKVRRFNFLQYSDQDTPVLQLLHNPDVTVRNRGVMEKCTYCIQRISHARIESKKLEAQMADCATPGEQEKLKRQARQAIDSVVTACQQACPTETIVFGNWADSETDLYHLKQLKTNYALLNEDLQTMPRTSYLAKIQNPNPLLGPGQEKHPPEAMPQPHQVETRPASGSAERR